MEHNVEAENLQRRISELETELAACREALEESQQQQQLYRLFFENNRDGIVRVDMNGRFLDANRAYCKMVGYSIETLKTMEHFHCITPERWHAWEMKEIWNKRLLHDGFTGVYEKEYIPNMTGFELAQELRAIRPGLPVILCTGYSETVTGEKAAEAGIAQLMLKPLDKDKIQATIQQILRRVRYNPN